MEKAMVYIRILIGGFPASALCNRLCTTDSGNYERGSDSHGIHDWRFLANILLDFLLRICKSVAGAAAATS